MQAPPPCFAEFSKKSASPLVEEEVDEGRQEQAQQDRDRVRNGTRAPPKVEGLSIFLMMIFSERMNKVVKIGSTLRDWRPQHFLNHLADFLIVKGNSNSHRGTFIT